MSRIDGAKHAVIHYGPATIDKLSHPEAAARQRMLRDMRKTE